VCIVENFLWLFQCFFFCVCSSGYKWLRQTRLLVLHIHDYDVSERKLALNWDCVARKKEIIFVFSLSELFLFNFLEVYFFIFPKSCIFIISSRFFFLKLLLLATPIRWFESVYTTILAFNGNSNLFIKFLIIFIKFFLNFSFHRHHSLKVIFSFISMHFITFFIFFFFFLFTTFHFWNGVENVSLLVIADCLVLFIFFSFAAISFQFYLFAFA
jgi:hypothetical protein